MKMNFKKSLMSYCNTFLLAYVADQCVVVDYF